MLDAELEEEQEEPPQVPQQLPDAQQERAQQQPTPAVPAAAEAMDADAAAGVAPAPEATAQAGPAAAAGAPARGRGRQDGRAKQGKGQARAQQGKAEAVHVDIGRLITEMEAFDYRKDALSPGLFTVPVLEQLETCPGVKAAYESVIDQTMDLATIRKAYNNGEYSRDDEGLLCLEEDMERIAHNCITFNEDSVGEEGKLFRKKWRAVFRGVRRKYNLANDPIEWLQA